MMRHGIDVAWLFFMTRVFRPGTRPPAERTRFIGPGRPQSDTLTLKGGGGVELDEQEEQDRERYFQIFIDVMQDIYPGMTPQESKVALGKFPPAPEATDRFLAALFDHPDWDDKLWKYVVEVQKH
jgi:hypothetical protein